MSTTVPVPACWASRITPTTEIKTVKSPALIHRQEVKERETQERIAQASRVEVIGRGKPYIKKTVAPEYEGFTLDYVARFRAWVIADEKYRQEGWALMHKHGLSSSVILSREEVESKPDYVKENSERGKPPERPFSSVDEDPDNPFIEDERSLYWLKQKIKRELGYTYDSSVLGGW